jgi:hypothetical protein
MPFREGWTRKVYLGFMREHIKHSNKNHKAGYASVSDANKLILYPR